MRVRKRSLPSPHLKKSTVRKIALTEVRRTARLDKTVPELERALRNEMIKPKANVEQLNAITHNAAKELGRLSRNYHKLERSVAQATATRVLDHYRIFDPAARKRIHLAAQGIAKEIYDNPIGEPMVPTGRLIVEFERVLGNSRKANSATVKMIDEMNNNFTRAKREFGKFAK